MAKDARGTPLLCVAGVRGKASRGMRAVRDTVERARMPLLNGALTRVGVVLALFPLDAIKTRAQLRTAHTPVSPFALLRPGGATGVGVRVFRGAGAGALAAVGAGALSFVVFSTISRSRPSASTTASTKPAAAAPAGASAARSPMRSAWLAAELAACAWAVPLEGAKTRVQAGLHSTSLRALREAARGPLKLYAGGLAHLARELPTRALTVVLAAQIAHAIASRRNGKALGKPAEAAAVAGVVAALTAPLDLVRTRVLAQRVGSARLYHNFAACALDVVKREGPLALFRGAPLRVAYLTLSAGLFATGFGFTERTLKENQWLWYRQNDADAVVARGE